MNSNLILVRCAYLYATTPTRVGIRHVQVKLAGNTEIVLIYVCVFSKALQKCRLSPCSRLFLFQNVFLLGLQGMLVCEQGNTTWPPPAPTPPAAPAAAAVPEEKKEELPVDYRAMYVKSALQVCVWACMRALALYKCVCVRSLYKCVCVLSLCISVCAYALCISVYACSRSV